MASICTLQHNLLFIHSYTHSHSNGDNLQCRHGCSGAWWHMEGCRAICAAGPSHHQQQASNSWRSGGSYWQPTCCKINSYFMNLCHHTQSPDLIPATNWWQDLKNCVYKCKHVLYICCIYLRHFIRKNG